MSSSSSETFQAIRVHEFGPESVMKLESVPLLEPSEHEVLIKVMAVGINPVDTYIRAGTYARKPALPYTPGSDGAGIITKVGDQVTAFKVGDRVWISGSRTGTYAQYCISSQDQIVSLPDHVTFSQGAAMNVPYATAYRALFIRGNAKPGEVVFIHGASGGVGIAAVQLAVAAGLTVVGTAGTPEGRALVLRQGAKAVFDHTAEGYLEEVAALLGGPSRVDVVVEMLADKNLEADIALLGKGGRVMVVGNRGRVEINPRGLMAVEADVRGVALAHTSPAERRVIDAALTAGLQQRVLQPIADATPPLPLEQAPQAHFDVMNTRRLGKLVLEPW